MEHLRGCPRGHLLVKSLNHFVRNKERNHEKSQEIINNHIKSSQLSLQSSILNLHIGGLKSREITLESYENDSNNMMCTEITQNYAQSTISWTFEIARNQVLIKIICTLKQGAIGSSGSSLGYQVLSFSFNKSTMKVKMYYW